MPFVFHLGVSPLPTPTMCSMSAAKICEDHNEQVGGKPNIVITQILIDIDQDKDARDKYPEQNICQLRDRVGRKQLRVDQQINEHHYPWKKE